MDKITFIQLIMTKLTSIETSILLQFCTSLQRLSTAHSWKVKYKILNIFKHLIEIATSKQKILHYTILIKCLFNISKGLFMNQTYR